MSTNSDEIIKRNSGVNTMASVCSLAARIEGVPVGATYQGHIPYSHRVNIVKQIIVTRVSALRYLNAVQCPDWNSR